SRPDYRVICLSPVARQRKVENQAGVGCVCGACRSGLGFVSGRICQNPMGEDFLRRRRRGAIRDLPVGIADVRRTAITGLGPWTSLFRAWKPARARSESRPQYLSLDFNRSRIGWWNSFFCWALDQLEVSMERAENDSRSSARSDAT